MSAGSPDVGSEERAGPDAPSVDERITRQPDVTGKATAGLAAEKEPSTTLAEPAFEPAFDIESDEETERGAVESKLEEIWRDTHDGQPPDRSSRGWQVVRDAFLNSEILVQIGQALVKDAREQGDEGDLAGDVGTVNVLVRSFVRTAEPEELRSFIGTRLAPTIARLEREMDMASSASREQIVDVLIAALRPLPDLTAERTPELELFRYLIASGDDGGGTGFYVTAASLAALRANADDAIKKERSYMLHYALEGTWRLLAGDPAAAALDGAGGTQALVSNAAGNLALATWLLAEGQKAGLGPDDQVSRVVLELKRLQAVVAREPGVDEDLAAHALRRLGLPREQPPLAMLAAIERAGAPPTGSWLTGDPADNARVAAANAVVEGLTGGEGLVAPRLFNAALRIDRIDRSSEPPYLRTRLLLYALGLRWVLRLAAARESRLGDILPDAMQNLNGLDCAVNLLADMAQASRENATGALPWAGLIKLAQLLASIPGALGLGGFNPDAARMSGSAQQLGLAPAAVLPLDELPARVESALAGLRVDRPDPAGEANVLLDTASAIGAGFAELAGGWENGRWLEELSELARKREGPLGYFMESYRPFADPETGEPPLVAAGILDGVEWRELGEGFRTDPGSIAPTVASLSR